MEFPIEKLLPLLLILGIGLWSCLGVWVWILLRKQAGQPVLPVAWRRPVPWRGIDLILFIVGYLSLSFLIVAMGTAFSDSSSGKDKGKIEKRDPPKDLPKVAPEADPPKKERGHEVALALRSDDPWMIGLCFFVAVIFAPLSEEIIFRMFIQGYFEKIDGLFRCRQRRIGRLLAYDAQNESQSSFLICTPWGVWPILLTSAIFAMLHFRLAKDTPSMEDIWWTMIVAVSAGSIALTILLFWLRIVRRAKLSDFGIVPREIPRDIFRGFIAFLGIAFPVYMVQVAAASLVPESIAPDPISIFVLSVAFGTVWCRTHRLVPSIVMHMSLNATSLGLAMYLLR